MDKEFFEGLGFYEVSPTPLYKLPLPNSGVYLLSTKDGALWIEYDEGHGEQYKQSVGIGEFDSNQIIDLIKLLQNCK
jgi:hypothetical protein